MNTLVNFQSASPAFDGQFSVGANKLFFPTGTQHDAYVKIRDILRGARQAIIMVDSYVDGTILELLKSREAPINSLRILTLNCPGDFALEASKFQAQYANVTVELRRSRTFHDRFLVIDGAHCWHLGASIKDAGIRAFMVSQVEDVGNRDALLSQFERSWQAAQAIDPSSDGPTKRSGRN